MVLGVVVDVRWWCCGCWWCSFATRRPAGKLLAAAPLAPAAAACADNRSRRDPRATAVPVVSLLGVVRERAGGGGRVRYYTVGGGACH